MRSRIVIPAILGVLIATSAQLRAQKADAPGADLQPIIAGLKSSDRVERNKAITQIRAMDKVPPAVAEPLVGYVKLELENLVVPPDMGDSKKAEKIPLTGEEVSLTRIKANPKQYIDREFIMCGGISISDYYNFGYTNAADTHYSLDLLLVDKKAITTRDPNGHVYLSKDLGGKLAEAATKSQEMGFSGLLMRVKCTIYSFRCGSDESNADDSIEVLDWQSVNKEGTGWNPWVLESIAVGFALLGKIGAPVVPTLLDVVTSEQEFQGKQADGILRYLSITTLGSMSKANRDTASARLITRSKRLRSAQAKRWARQAAVYLAQGRR